MMWSPAHDLAIGLVTLLHWPLAAVGAGRGYYRGEPPGAAVAAARRAGSPWSEQMDRKMLRFVEKRGIRTDKTPPARTEVLSARGEESKPVAHPCRGPGGQAGDHRSGRVTPLLAPGNVVGPPTSLGRGAWGVTTLSANLAGDDSWVAGIELATASEPPARRPRIWGRCPTGVDPSHP